jgi:hypothetical protein
VSWGVGGVGVRMPARVLTIWEEGGGVMEEVVRGAGDVNFTRSGEASFDMSPGAADSERDIERTLGVSGPANSVVGTSESCDGWCRGVRLSILPKAQAVQAVGDTSGVRGAAGAESESGSQCIDGAQNRCCQECPRRRGGGQERAIESASGRV